MYWKMNKDMGNWGPEEMYRLFDFDVEELANYRGLFPHVVCRFELRQQLSELARTEGR